MVTKRANWCVPALRGVMGDWIYYTTLLSAREICDRIDTAHRIREAKELEDFLQRKLKEKVRVPAIARYILERESHFFNSIIVGVFDGLPKWIEFDLGKADRRLGTRKIDAMKESMGLLVFSGHEKMFAIDGQHRVEGIKMALKQDQKRVKDEQYPVVFVAHLETATGKVRSRRLFCDINKNAVAVSEGDKVVIDEDDLSAIVARRVFAEYAPFRRDKEIALTEKKEQLTPEDGCERFTSILAVYTVCKCLAKLHNKTLGVAEIAPANVEALKSIVTSFFDFVLQYEPSLNRYFHGRTTLRAQRRDNRNLFFRPVGLEVLARVYTRLASNNRLEMFRHGLQQLKFDNPGGIFDGILWNAGTIEPSSQARTAAVGLFLYLLNQLSPKREGDLQEALRKVTKNSEYILPRKLVAP